MSLSSMTKLSMLALVLAVPVRADDLDGARAKLADIRAMHAHEAAANAAAAPAPAAIAPAQGAAPAAAPAAPAAPLKPVDLRASTGPGRPDLKLSGSIPYLGAPFDTQRYRVIIEEHLYSRGDRIRGAQIKQITASHVTFEKDGDVWTLPANNQ